MFLIQGVFFPRFEGFSTYKGQEKSELVHEVLRNVAFQGALFPGPDEKLVGEMKDPLGPSVVYDVSLDENELRFTKMYNDPTRASATRDCKVEYVLRRQPDGTWVGEYLTTNRYSGVARCVLVEVPDDFLDSPPVEEPL